MIDIRFGKITIIDFFFLKIQRPIICSGPAKNGNVGGVRDQIIFDGGFHRIEAMLDRQRADFAIGKGSDGGDPRENGIDFNRFHVRC